MKIINISLRELLKNKLYFSYFAAGLALLTAVVCVVANYSDQVFGGFFTQFYYDGVLALEMSELPPTISESEYYGELPILARGSGATYNISVSCGERSVFLPSYRSGVCVVSEGKLKFSPWSLTKALLPFLVLGRFDVSEGDTVLLSDALAEELGAERGDIIGIGGREFRAEMLGIESNSDFSFMILDSGFKADEYTVIVSNQEQLLDVIGRIDPDHFNDSQGLMALCEGYRAMRAAMRAVVVLLAVICAAFIFVFVKMYLEKRAGFVSNLSVLGIGGGRLFGVLGAVFLFLCFLSGAVGFLLSVLLDLLVDKWARELIGMHVDDVNYLAYFAVGALISAAVAGLSLLVGLSRKLRGDEVRNE